MGVSLEFLLGDVEAIKAAVADFELDDLDDPKVVDQRADMSLHIVPHDLDSLSRCMASYNGRLPLDLRSYLEVAVDSEDGGVLLVGKDWVDYAAGVPEASIGSLLEDWFSAMRDEHGNPEIQVTDDAMSSVGDLLSLCRRAKQETRQPVHVWLP